MSRLLVIDDDQSSLELMRRVLTLGGYQDVVCLADPAQALQQLDQLAPDLILLDLHMTGLDGFEVLRRLALRETSQESVPRLVITADATGDTRRRALGLGASDFLTKPIDVVEATLRVGNLLTTRSLHRRLRSHNEELQTAVRVRTAELAMSQREVTIRLARATEYRDDDTAEHVDRVGRLAADLARRCGVPEDEVELIALAAPLHDIGKVAVPDAVLLKPGPLTPAERALMETHAAKGAHILSGGTSRLVRLAEDIAHSHHERWDGEGYPRRLAGEAIPLGGRLVAIADVFDALTHARPYKPAWSVERAVEAMRRQRERHFDPSLLDVFISSRG